MAGNSTELGRLVHGLFNVGEEREREREKKKNEGTHRKVVGRDSDCSLCVIFFHKASAKGQFFLTKPLLEPF